jgi:hypothetical protein
MKYVITLIYILYIIVYGYSTYMTSVEPDNKLWGFLCTFIFGFLSVWGVILYTKYFTEKEKNSEEN